MKDVWDLLLVCVLGLVLADVASSTREAAEAGRRLTCVASHGEILRAGAPHIAPDGVPYDQSRCVSISGLETCCFR